MASNLSATMIVDRALVLLDEKPVDLNQVATTEMSLKEMGLEILPEVCLNLIRELPFELKHLIAEEQDMFPDDLTEGEKAINLLTSKKKAAWQLPIKFWDMVSFSLDWWSKPVTKYIYIDGEEYERQNNPFTRAGVHNPVIAISEIKENTGTTGHYRLEVFSVSEKEPTGTKKISYIAYDNVPDDIVGGKRWDDRLLEVTAKALASELLVIKNKIAEGTARGDDVLTDIEQHE